MNKYKEKYNKQIKRKVVTFYKCDKEIYDYANTINFQAFVKSLLKEMVIMNKLMKIREGAKDGEN